MINLAITNIYWQHHFSSNPLVLVPIHRLDSNFVFLVQFGVLPSADGSHHLTENGGRRRRQFRVLFQKEDEAHH